MTTVTRPAAKTRMYADGAAARRLDLAELARLNPERYPFLLESAAAAGPRARFDILFAFPGATLELSASSVLSGPHAPGQDFLGALDAWWSEAREVSADSGCMPFRGGWFIYLGYGLASEIEAGIALERSSDLPTAFATRVPLAIIRDHAEARLYLVAEDESDPRLDCLENDLGELARRPSAPLQPAQGSLVEDSPAEFLQAVAQAKRYIAAGDNYQTNLSRCWRVELSQPLPPAELYLRLRESNPAPFAGLVQHPRFAVIASSPERLVRRCGDRIDTRPIAGTHPRSMGTLDTETSALLAHPKERAEHVMLIDLERNDLGRVCRAGSVVVDEFMVVESYPHVHHIVSNVSGIARPGLKPGELLRAVFPGGTITGCPKVRSMEIIADLERRPRGAYTGSVGYLNHNGDCDFNILIRTVTQRGASLEIAAGSGIVADSDPQQELAETRSKARGMLLALDRPGDSILS